MAEFLVAAQDLESGYLRGDPIVAVEDGHVWGSDEGLPLFWIIKVPSVSLEVAKGIVQTLIEPAQPGDEEFTAPDLPDRIIRRARRDVMVFVDDLPRPRRLELEATGITTLSLGQARNAYRRKGYNRATMMTEDLGIGALG